MLPRLDCSSNTFLIASTFHPRNGWNVPREARCCYYRYSATVVVSKSSISSAITAFGSARISQLLTPGAIPGDQVFKDFKFGLYVQRLGVGFRPVPSKKKHMSTSEPKHGTIRSIFLRVASAFPDLDKRLLVFQALQVSNDLYCSKTLISFEMAKGFTKPVCAGQSVSTVPDELTPAQDTVLAKRKLDLILRSKAIVDPNVRPGDPVQVFFL